MDVLPEGDPPRMAPMWNPLLEDPCRICGSTQLFPQTGKQVGIAGGGEPIELTLTILCGDCGDIDERTKEVDSG